MATNDKQLPGAYLDPAPSTYGQQMANVGGALFNLLGNAGRFLVSAPGSGSPFAAGNAPVAPVVPNTPANAAGLAQADAANVPAVTAAVPAAKPAAAAAAPAASGTKAAAAPKAPALIPGETGYYNENNQLVPYGVNLAAGVPAAGVKGVPAGAAGLIDPRGFFPSAVDAQMQYAREAANSILNMAGDGSQLGYSARLRALSAIFNNGLAQVGQGGANNYNSGITGMVGSQLSADAQRATAGINAGIASADRALAREDMMTRFYATPQAIGSEMVTDPLTKMSVPRPLYGVPQRGGGFATIGDSAAATKPKEGATGKTPDGRAVVYKNGTWTEK